MQSGTIDLYSIACVVHIEAIVYATAHGRTNSTKFSTKLVGEVYPSFLLQYPVALAFRSAVSFALRVTYPQPNFDDFRFSCNLYCILG